MSETSPRLIFVGQAPSRVGDGRPFSGPSGARLVKLLGLEDYEALARSFALTNIFDRPAERREVSPDERSSSYNAVGDGFDRIEGLRRAQSMLRGWIDTGGPIIAVAMGHNVYRALVCERGVFFKGKRLANVEVWCFPHPSGASAYWNDPERVERAGRFIRKLAVRSGFEGA